MRVFKFGGASVKDPAGVRNVASIIRDHGDKSLVVVVSAMAKTTNALEKLTQYYIEGQTDAMMKVFGEVRQFHLDITNELFNDPKHSAHFHVKQTFFHLQRYIEEKPSGNYNYE